MDTGSNKKQQYDVLVNSRYEKTISADVLRALNISLAFSDSVKAARIRTSEKYDKHTADNILNFLKIKEKYFTSFDIFKKSKNITKQSIRHNVIDIGAQYAEEHKIVNNQIIHILLPSTFEVMQCTVYINRGISDYYELRLPSVLRDYDDTKVVLLQSELYVGNKINLQKVINIKDDVIALDHDMYHRIAVFAPEYVDFRHIATGATITRKFSSVLCDDNLKAGQIRLNYNQREELNIFDAQKNSQKSSYFPILLDKIKRTNDSIDDYVDVENTTVKSTYNQVQIVPVIARDKKSFALIKNFCDLLVGSSRMNLLAMRPYKIDDSRCIVRLSEDTMTLLGIEETDRIILKYKDKECKASALKIDSYELMQETNIIDSKTDLDLAIGIPSPLRKELGIGDVETEMTIERDTVFLFNKNINIQLLSVLGLLLAVFQIGEGAFLIKAITCLALLPIIIYASLSQERSKVQKHKKKKKR